MDLKMSNILLDENLQPKISEFGLARMFEGDQTIERTKRVVGTYGYMVPEYAFNGRFSAKSDIFSMGVVIFEIEPRELEMMDGCYNSSYVEWQVNRCIQVRLLCVQNSADERPLMPSVVLMLSTEETALPEPNKAGFFLDSSFITPPHIYASGNSITITETEGR
ncbi:hypothetical protein C2S52_013069 [Perilla frutescens var. hirtella]|nr:hypothetical protein C2S51_015408 [Perilla frutescens var. frutescens]KAH6775508.1 hypothetical protein C2S52_013069 [Perilla frutescens var. hirtella]